jgi:hypothetical protein
MKETASANSLFVEGKADDSDLRAPSGSAADEEFDGSEPSLDEIAEQIPVLHEKLLSMVCTLEFWGTLVDKYKKSKKYKPRNEGK